MFWLKIWFNNDLLRIYYVQNKKSYYEFYYSGFAVSTATKLPVLSALTHIFLFLFWNIYRCVWCQITVHDDCLSSLNDDLCDLGEFRSVIIPPYYLYQVNKLRRRHPDEYSKVRIHPQTHTSVKVFTTETNFFSFKQGTEVIGPKTAFVETKLLKWLVFYFFFCLKGDVPVLNQRYKNREQNACLFLQIYLYYFFIIISSASLNVVYIFPTCTASQKYETIVSHFTYFCTILHHCVV